MINVTKINFRKKILVHFPICCACAYQHYLLDVNRCSKGVFVKGTKLNYFYCQCIMHLYNSEYNVGSYFLGIYTVQGTSIFWYSYIHVGVNKPKLSCCIFYHCKFIVWFYFVSCFVFMYFSPHPSYNLSPQSPVPHHKMFSGKRLTLAVSRSCGIPRLSCNKMAS